MDIDVTKIVRSILNLSYAVNDDVLRLWANKILDIQNMDAVLELLSKKMLDPIYTEHIINLFPEIIILIASKAISYDKDNFDHLPKCIALGKLVNTNQYFNKFAQKYFSVAPSPFIEFINPKLAKRCKSSFNFTDLEVVKCCYILLNSDAQYYKNAWKWSDFMSRFLYNGCDIQKFFTNNILATVTNMPMSQVENMNLCIKASCRLELTDNFYLGENKCETKLVEIEDIERNTNFSEIENNLSKWKFASTDVTSIEGVLLPIYNLKNIHNCLRKANVSNRLILVETTKANLRNIAIHIMTDKIICLNGPVGSGKTSLVEYIAEQTGRFGKTPESEKCGDKDHVQSSFGNIIEEPSTGYLRIQIGDQTDTKILLGHYRCSDVPGEFIWQTGPLTKAVMEGSWILLEDIDLATQDVIITLSNLIENAYLNVPGFNERLQIKPGFQLFATIRNKKNQNTNYTQMLNKHMIVVNILPMTQNELCAIINELFPRYNNIDKGIVERIVNVYMKFSSGGHQSEKDTSYSLVETASKRQVSTRDLIKLCQRSHLNFYNTNESSRLFILKNAVDVFCAYLPTHKMNNNLISIGAELNIGIAVCEDYANQYMPEIILRNDKIIVGRVPLLYYIPNEKSHDIEPTNQHRRNMAVYANVLHENKDRFPTFSFTRVACCLMERIAVSVQQNEPVLLVGETGVGKTSSVQYLAHHTNHKLVVLNMNNQSEVSDLIGGFKPVDFSICIGPIRTEFESIFKHTYDSAKNQTFLNNLSVCFKRSEYVVIVKLMLKITHTALIKISHKSKANLSLVAERWQKLKTKLLKLDEQLKQSIFISFAFINGSLVKCIENGDWVLLDEINLASVETLECLSTILEPDGSVILLEKGDLIPIKRNPNFRIFACMNPSTDVGKKELPVGIRNRFSEYYVDELENLSDIEILIHDYLIDTGIKSSKVNAIARLYDKLRQLARLDLNDGLGNRPIFSLRTLCRALSITAKNLCGSIERNLFESFCLSFLTQLDSNSRKCVINIIQNFLLSNPKAVLEQPIPKPKSGEYINFEGFWIEKGNLPIEACNNYILTESVRHNLKDLSRIISIGRLPVLLQGPTSAGKTSLIDYVARRSGVRCLRINNHEHTDLQEYIGSYTADADGRLFFREGLLVDAMRNGYWIILDELNLASCDILEALNRVLDDNRELYIAETQTLIKAHPNFMLFATQNPPGVYGGRKALSRAFKNRFIELHFSDIPRIELEIILEKRCLIPKSYAQKMVKTMANLHVNRKSNVQSVFTLRDLFRWGNRYTLADKTLLQNGQYDWNQHLVDEGYLTLSAKIRDESEVQFIEETLFNIFRKRVNMSSLFDDNNQTSMVTKHILNRIAAHPVYDRFVWTFNMRRMAVLVSKAIQFNEPILLVGPTGCGKTTVCQILAEISNLQIRILNCHMHTESSDFIGCLRPFRSDETNSTRDRKLFEWYDGPLIMSMVEGSFFLADEISLAEDSVLERLNCILEPDRTILLSEKNSDTSSTNMYVVGKPGFQFLATMNPGGDFGKRELSPALRNRFTEIWCRSTDSKDDLYSIACNGLRRHYNSMETHPFDIFIDDVGYIIVNCIFHMKEQINKFTYSIRDVLAWIDYINIHASIDLSLPQALVFGIETIFLDSLEMLQIDNMDSVNAMRSITLTFLIKQMNIRNVYAGGLDEIHSVKGTHVELDKNQFGIHPFYINRTSNSDHKLSYDFNAPTTRTNLFRLLSAHSLSKPILLEGPPGVGKTSLIEQVSGALGYNMVRINLCEQTDISDLFGADLPVTASLNDEDTNLVGAFEWHDGPLLSALKTQNTWILLDELNLAAQSVLEGLNAILDHRGEVFIPELNKTFTLARKTRIFASQNPAKQGGGRKGLPQSFLNRFTKVYLSKLNNTDLMHVVQSKYGPMLRNVNMFVNDIQIPTEYNICEFDLCHAMVSFTMHLDESVSHFKFGTKGGPFEFNLRDILRWCEFIFDTRSGGYFLTTNKSIGSLNNFIQIVFEKMLLVYGQRLRSSSDHEFVRYTFKIYFPFYNEQGNTQDISLYWTNNAVYFDDICCTNENSSSTDFKYHTNRPPLLLSSQREYLKNITESMIFKETVILCGPSDCGKSMVIDVICTILNRKCLMESLDDSVIGGFQQVDLKRHLEDIAMSLEEILFGCIHSLSKQNDMTSHIVKLFKMWETFRDYIEACNKSKSNDLNMLLNCMDNLQSLYNEIIKYDVVSRYYFQVHNIELQITSLKNMSQQVKAINSGGYFEWVDSKMVTSYQNGNVICLDNVNLCSSAILDRLNPVFEKDGCLLLSEKGVTANNKTVSIKQHQEFQAFLTMNPKYGEISRAMRNRCIEISFNLDEYPIDDLKTIIFRNGIRDMFLIQAILNIHNRCRLISPYSSFGVAHIMKCVNLFVRYRQLFGKNYIKILYQSSYDIYVCGSNTDYTGLGLNYYRSLLTEQICGVLQELHPKQDMFNYGNIIDVANRLNTGSLIAKQCEVLLTVIRCLITDDIDVHSELVGLFDTFRNVELKYDLLLCKLMLKVIYECSSNTDLNQRYIYLKNSIQNILDNSNNNTLVFDMLTANEELFQSISSDSQFIRQHIDLPWNTDMFPRLSRYYGKQKVPLKSQKHLSALLFFKMILKNIQINSHVNIDKIDVISFSKLLNINVLQNVPNCEILLYIYPYLTQAIDHMESMLKSKELDIATPNDLVNISYLFLWINRLYLSTRRTLFISKKIDESCINLIIRHIKWLEKKLVRNLPNLSKNVDFSATRATLLNLIQSKQHPLYRLSKRFKKKYTEFLPYYNMEKLELDEKITIIIRETEISNLYGYHNNKDTISQRLHILNDHNIKSIFLNIASLKVKEFEISMNAIFETDANEYIKEHSQKCENDIFTGETFISDCSNIQDISSILNSNINDCINLIQKYDSFLNISDVCVLSFREYFIMKYFSSCMYGVNKFEVNPSYFTSTKSLGLNIVCALNIIQSKCFARCEHIWKEFWQRDYDYIRSNIDLLPIKLYKYFGTTCRNLHATLHNFQMQSLCMENKEDYHCGPVFSKSVLNMLLDNMGKFKSCSLMDYTLWIESLSSITELLWNNSDLFQPDFNLEYSNLNLSFHRSKQLLVELDLSLSEHAESLDSVMSDFMMLREMLRSYYLRSESIYKLQQFSKDRKDLIRTSSSLNCIIGVIELHLFACLPAIDTVEKDRLKTLYLNQDKTFIQQVLGSIQCMRITMKYNQLAYEQNSACEQIKAQLLKKYPTSKSAIRPEENLYSDLIKDINHFVNTCCTSESMIGLLVKISCILDTTVQDSVQDLTKRIDLWISNAKHFLHQTVCKFSNQFIDIIKPIENSMTMLIQGLQGLQYCLTNRLKKKDDTLCQLIKYPSLHGLRYLLTEESPIYRLNYKSNNAFHKNHVLLLLIHLREIENEVQICSSLSNNTIHRFADSLKVMNQIWNMQQEIRHKINVDNDSLYVTKTRCVEESEDTLIERELTDIFPNTIIQDFGDLDKSCTLNGNNIINENNSIISDSDISEIYRIFINVMNNFSTSYYKPPNSTVLQNYNRYNNINDYKKKIEIFSVHLTENQFSFDSKIDEHLYNGALLLFGSISIEIKNNDSLNIGNYNFYQDSNISEVLKCFDILLKVGIRAKCELDIYPDHAGLIDVINIIKRIQSFSILDPIIRFSSGFQLLAKKINEWNLLAHQGNTMIDLEIELGTFIQRWMNMELNCWKTCLKQSYFKIQAKSKYFWFYLYNLINEYLYQDITDNNKKIIKTKDITAAFNQFMESANYADFSLRMQMLKSFEQFIQYIDGDISSKRKQLLITILYNTQLFYEQFAFGIEEKENKIRTSIEKKIKDVVKIESFSKYLSYFSQDSNISQVHRKLLKCIKQYETEISERVNQTFISKDNIYNLEKIFIDVNISTFMKSDEKLYISLLPSIQFKDMKHLRKCTNLFDISVNIVKQSLNNITFPNMISSVCVIAKEHVETLKYLRNLEVDRSTDKSKHKLQAKHILQQKRKALTDLYKVLTRLGFSYRAGLMESILSNELIDLRIPPFCIPISIDGTEHNLFSSFQLINHSFSSSVFKLKQVQAIILTPHTDISAQHIERIKGFIVDMFLFVQNQRKIISLFVYNISQIGSHIKTLNDLRNGLNDNFCNLSFESLRLKYNEIRQNLTMIFNVFVQYDLLLSTSPEDVDISKNKLLRPRNIIESSTNQNSQFARIKSICICILDKTKLLLSHLKMIEEKKILNSSEADKIDNEYAIIKTLILEVISVVKVDSNSKNMDIHATSIIELHEHLTASDTVVNNYESVHDMNIIDEKEQIDNFIHALIFPIQCIYKKYSCSSLYNHDTINTDDLIKENHLKILISKNMYDDIESLKTLKVSDMLTEIIIYVQNYSANTNRQKYIELVVCLLPILEQYHQLCLFYMIQQLNAHIISNKILNICSGVFIELCTKGFCIPHDLLSEDEANNSDNNDCSDGFGLDDGVGENDVSDRLESEDQLDSAKKPGDYEDKDNPNCNEEKGVEMSDDFESKLQDMSKENSTSDSEESDSEDAEKQMGETELGAEQLDNKIWGSNDDETNNEEEIKQDEYGTGNELKDDIKDLAQENPSLNQNGVGNDNTDGITDSENQSKNESGAAQEEIDEVDEQNNPYHNGLEEPMETEDIDIEDNMNLDEDNVELEDNSDVNPFDIDEMKNEKSIDNNIDDITDKDMSSDNSNNNSDISDSEEEQDNNDSNNAIEDFSELGQNDDTDTVDDNKETNLDSTEHENPDICNQEENSQDRSDVHQSNSLESKEESSIQCMPQDNIGPVSNDVKTNMDIQNYPELTDSDLNHDKDNNLIGQEHNNDNNGSQHGDGKSMESKSNKTQSDVKEYKRKYGSTDDERTLGNPDQLLNREFNTVNNENQMVNNESDDTKFPNSEEYQHVKESNPNDKSTFDNATEDQAFNSTQDDNALNEDEALNNQFNDNSNELDKIKLNDKLKSELNNTQKAEMQVRKKHMLENKEKDSIEFVEFDGCVVDTHSMKRPSETISHVNTILLKDDSNNDLTNNMNAFSVLNEISSEGITSTITSYATWEAISLKMLPSAREFCEQLRLILEPTKCTRLKGDYRSGRRLNLKKIIPYIASQFRKDKIWLRRTKPAQRDYKITIAIDDSKSMAHNNSKLLTLEAISLVAQALTLLESGSLSIMSFGEKPHLILNHSEMFDGPKICSALNFEQNQSKIAELMNFVQEYSNMASNGSENNVFEHLLLVLSDGRNIFSEGEQIVKNSIKLTRLKHIFVVYIIIDNPENTNSILDIRVPIFTEDRKSMTFKSYLEIFPFPYYVIVRDLAQLPSVLSDAMRQWFEMVNVEC